ncbi:Rhodanese-like protein [Piedraia hortae CBS 480.64]|uniref:Rhodanese-like protein n=1 Tax=Piedraia hortae CBS 480.64 TaxID=1314780 RepID=A0A6A7C767_9PEZI|nr:Rhodanese-like protein [Piedraia hortae CBS 480.64]
MPIPRLPIGSIHRLSTSPFPHSSITITPAQLFTALRSPKTKESPRILPISAGWFMPNDPFHRTGHNSFLTQHIPGSVFFDLDAISDETSPYTHMLPPPTKFADAMSKLGVKRDDTLVVYDTVELGLFSAPRVAWTFRHFGHKSVFVLDNFKLWVEQGYGVEEGEMKVRERSEYPVPGVDERVVGFEEMKELVGGEDVTIVDARPEGRWSGRDPEPREGLPSGHMPGSVNIPFGEVLEPERRTLRGREELRNYFEKKGVVEGKPVVSTCGSGVTATLVDLALREAGYKDTRVYDGSWTEWAQRVDGDDGRWITKSQK